MSNRRPDIACLGDEVYYDGYNLQTGIEDDPAIFHHLSSDENGTYVLATLRNVFGESNDAEYEMTSYDSREQMPSSDARVAEKSELENQVSTLQSPQEDEDDHEEDDDEFRGEEQKDAYHCTECNKTYTSERRLKHHLVVHKNKEAYKCPKCGYCYQSPDSLKRHMKKTPECNPDAPITNPAEGDKERPPEP